MRKRGIYRKVAPHYVWHVDGTHKLIHPYRLVIHVGIDGYSRCCTFAVCSNNNKASTVLKRFKVAVREYGLPAKVRADFGGENVKVGRLMKDLRGENAFITGTVN